MRTNHGISHRVATPWHVLAIVFLALAAGVQSPAAVQEAAVQVVKATTDRLFSEISRAPHRSEEIFLDVLSPHLALEVSSKWVLGKHWRTMTPEQRSRFMTSFRGVLARSYASAIASQTEARVEYLPSPPPSADGKATVRTRVVRAGDTQPLRIDYRLVESAGTWKVFDIVIEGVSLVANYRSSFDSEITKHGVDALIRTLARKGAALENG